MTSKEIRGAFFLASGMGFGLALVGTASLYPYPIGLFLLSGSVGSALGWGTLTFFAWRREKKMTALTAYTAEEKHLILEFWDGGGVLCCNDDNGFIEKNVAKERQTQLRDFAYDYLGCEPQQKWRDEYRVKLVRLLEGESFRNR